MAQGPGRLDGQVRRHSVLGPNLVSVVDSKLRLRVEKRGGLWAGGLVHTRDRIAWTYGYFEIRAKCLRGKGYGRRYG
jgi:beta-glucanase (GH16 family)